MRPKSQVNQKSELLSFVDTIASHGLPTIHYQTIVELLSEYKIVHGVKELKA